MREWVERAEIDAGEGAPAGFEDGFDDLKERAVGVELPGGLRVRVAAVTDVIRGGPGRRLTGAAARRLNRRPARPRSSRPGHELAHEVGGARSGACWKWA